MNPRSIFRRSHRRARRSDSAARGDAGFTLPEVLIAMTVSGILVAALSMAFSVVVASGMSATNRVAESKDVTFVQTWLPADLSSATQTWITPKLPFPFDAEASLPKGSNVLTLARPNLATGETYLVMYRYEVLEGRGFVLARYRVGNPGCPNVINPVVGNCASGPETVKRIGVAYELPEPPNGDAWDNELETPHWAVEVSHRNFGGNTNGSGTEERPVGEDVTVHFKSGNTYVAGGSGLSAGQLIDPSPEVIPDPTAPPSRCGRRILLLVDLSTSILYSWGSSGPIEMRAAATSFVDAFRGTPGEMSVVGYDKWIEPLSHPGLPYSQPDNPGQVGVYFDLLNDPEGTADFLTDTVFPGMDGLRNTSRPYGFGPHSQGNMGGGTNWEIALMSSFATPKDWHEHTGNSDNRTKDRSDIEYHDSIPDMVVLLTDGNPNRRLDEQYNYLDFMYDGDNQHTRVTNQARDMANVAREFGVKDVVGVLVGATTYEDRLATVVGGTAWDGGNPGNAAVADYFATDFSRLGEVIGEITKRECGGALTIQKRFSDGANPSASGVWDFESEQGGKSLDYGSASSVTFQHQFQNGDASYDFWIEEIPRDGFALNDVACEVGGDPVSASRITRIDPANAEDPVRYVFDIRADEAMSCLFVSDIV